MADDNNPEEPSAHQRLCWWRDPEYYDMDGFPKERAADPEARHRFERAQAERQFRGNLDLLDGVPRSRHELLIAGSLENYITVFLHHALSAFGDSLLDKRISGTEAIREFEQHANELLTETFNHKWLFALRRFELTEDESSEKQFWVVQKEAVENTRRDFEELLWNAELEEAASPVRDCARECADEILPTQQAGVTKPSRAEPTRTEAGPAQVSGAEGRRMEQVAGVSGLQTIGKKKRGRPTTISDETKTAALRRKDGGGSNRDAAMILYSTKYPTPQQVKNVSTHLRVYRARVQKDVSPAPKHLRRSGKANKNRG